IDDEPEALPCPALCQISMNPEFLPECMRQWQEQWQRGNFKEAQTIAAMACRLNPNNAEARHALIISDIMVAHCREHLDSGGKVRALLQRHRTFLHEGKLAEALAAARMAKELDPDNLDADAAIQIAIIKTNSIEYTLRSSMGVEDTPSSTPE